MLLKIISHLLSVGNDKKNIINKDYSIPRNGYITCSYCKEAIAESENKAHELSTHDSYIKYYKVICKQCLEKILDEDTSHNIGNNLEDNPDYALEFAKSFTKEAFHNTNQYNSETSYKTIIECSQTLEKHLRKNMHGDGKGLHELTSSIESELTEQDIKNLRLIATARNKLIHEGILILQIEAFQELCDKLKRKFNLD